MFCSAVKAAAVLIFILAGSQYALCLTNTTEHKVWRWYLLVYGSIYRRGYSRD